MKVLRPVDDPVVEYKGFLCHDLNVSVLDWHLLMDLLHRVKLPSVHLASFKAILHIQLIMVPHLLLGSEHLAILEHVDVDPLALQVIHLEHG